MGARIPICLHCGQSPSHESERTEVDCGDFQAASWSSSSWSLRAGALAAAPAGRATAPRTTAPVGIDILHHICYSYDLLNRCTD